MITKVSDLPSYARRIALDELSNVGEGFSTYDIVSKSRRGGDILRARIWLRLRREIVIRGAPPSYTLLGNLWGVDHAAIMQATKKIIGTDRDPSISPTLPNLRKEIPWVRKPKGAR